MISRFLAAITFLLTAAAAQGAALGIEEAVELALAADRRVTEALSAYEAAEAASLAAWGSYIPLLGFSSGYSRNWTGPSSMS
ncbi:MAG TPA: hypothetical protein ENN88_01715, partial [Candidatus Coatesbacteria bacterium]|nr:hypothetical protein [Candidatus Coatesbacteria bacterium]